MSKLARMKFTPHGRRALRGVTLDQNPEAPAEPDTDTGVPPDSDVAGVVSEVPEAPLDSGSVASESVPSPAAAVVTDDEGAGESRPGAGEVRESGEPEPASSGAVVEVEPAVRTPEPPAPVAHGTPKGKKAEKGRGKQG